MSFNQKLKALRTENNMTQQYLATRLNVARSTIAGYETKNRQPSHEKLTAIANLFNVTVDYLLSDDEVITMDPSAISTQTAEERTLLSQYRQLSSTSRHDLENYVALLFTRDRSDRS